MGAIGEHGRKGNFTRDGDALDEVVIIGQRGGAIAPSHRKAVKRHQTTEDEHCKMGIGRIGKDSGENKRHHPHHDDGVEKGPEDAKHIEIADSKLLRN
jgi:hypothetical protein